ncbi:Snf2 Rad54-like helicase [Tubulinosema ratisbonensis]|uniref:Snf2 Rad54-like helicase n=1 Tax=Tubulinosema ratisbonensis TaxID=291195 RepID=A0A437AK90_9MICR|nr:Snf2 Rad54-like helicase [Tubulinosema ratisbonensis]
MKKNEKPSVIDLYTKKLKVEEPSTLKLVNLENKVTTQNVPFYEQKKNLEPSKEILTSKKITCKLSINLNGMVEVYPSNKQISSFLSTFPSKQTVYEKEKWFFELSLYKEVTDFLKKNKLFYTEIPKGALVLASKKFSVNEFVFEHSIYKKLLPFQREGVNFALNRNGRIILADDMGLGKTIQALAIAWYYKLEFPLLIICPASLQDNWIESVRIFLEEKAFILKEKSDVSDFISVISYDRAAQLSNILKHKVIIADECHYLKSSQSKRTKNLLPILQNANRAILLSGTPALSRPLELYPLICTIDKTIFPSFNVYGMRYCDGKKIKHWFDYKGSSNSEELYFLIFKFMLRRTKDEVLSELPPKNRRHVILSPAIKEKLEIEQNELDKAFDSKVSPSVMQKYTDAAEVKIDVVKKYISEIIEKKIKFLVFAHHAVMLNALEEEFKKENIRIIRIDGNTPTHLRHEMCNSFQTDPSIQVALLSLTAANTGLTLTEGKMVIFAELYWNPGTMLQAEDRVHRIGQKSCVDIHYLVARNTIDEYVWPKLIKKLSVLESLGIQNNQLKNVKKEGDNFKIGK